MATKKRKPKRQASLPLHTPAGHLIRAARKRLGLSQDDVAQAIHSSRAQVASIEGCVTQVPAYRVGDLAFALDFTSAEIVQLVNAFREDHWSGRTGHR